MKILKRILFILLLIPFCAAIALVMIASLVYWIITGKNLFFVIDWIKLNMEKLLK